MHTIYQTDCYVLGTLPRGEANEVVFLLTREFGFIPAIAQGVRYLKSKSRYHLQSFKPCAVDLIRGKEFWRITSARPAADMYVPDSAEAQSLCARIGAIVRRLHHGEEYTPDTFFLFQEAIAHVGQVPERELELVAILKILDIYGYGPDENTLKDIVALPIPEAVCAAEPITKSLVGHINRALAASHL